MGTRSYIHIKKSNGTHFVSYIAHDSYPEEILATLDKIKNNSETEIIKTVRSISDNSWDNVTIKLKSMFRRKWWEDYLYIFDMHTRQVLCYRLRYKERHINLRYYNSDYDKYLVKSIG